MCVKFTLLIPKLLITLFFCVGNMFHYLTFIIMGSDSFVQKNNLKIFRGTPHSKLTQHDILQPNVSFVENISTIKIRMFANNGSSKYRYLTKWPTFSQFLRFPENFKNLDFLGVFYFSFILASWRYISMVV